MSPAEDYLEAAGDRWRDAFIPLLTGIVEDSGSTWLAQHGIAFNVRNIQGESWFQDYTLQFAQPLTETNSNTIHDLLAQAQAEGWSVPQMQDRLDQVFNQWIQGDQTPEDFEWIQQRMPAHRRELIARTETIRAANMGAYRIAHDWGATDKEWLAQLDNRTRPSHRRANGQRRAIDEAFDVGSYDMQHPHDMSLGAPLKEVANCRCVVNPIELDQEVVKEKLGSAEFPALDRDRADKLFDEWRDRWEKEPDEYREAIFYYSGGGYGPMNDWPRGLMGEPATADFVREQMDNLNAAIDNNRLDFSLTTYRGTGEFMNKGRKGGPLIPLEEFEQLPGKIISDAGFTSSSVIPEGAFSGEYFIEFRVPANNRGAFIAPMSRYDTEEMEYLMAQGSRWRVIEAYERPHPNPSPRDPSPTQRYMLVEVINE